MEFVSDSLAEFGFNEHHQNEAINYMRFARSKRVIRLKTIDSCFEDLKESRLVEETFTVDEAEKFYLRLQTDISELENRELLEQVAEFEKTELKNQNKTNQEISKPKLAPLNEGGVSELLNKEISRLQEENDKLKGRLRTLETQAMGALDEKTRAERALKDLQKIRGEEQMAARSQEITSLEDTVAALHEDYQKSLSVNAASQKELQDSLVSAKHDLLRVQEQLALAEKELEKKFQQTAAYRNMKEILTKKNEQIKDIRKRLSKYESDE
uniref:Leucine zipper transcription factor-like protein 1 n=1 Tax=Esox lucius TaxID=8010 RepID=A0AAY5KUY0_ESOLU